MDGYKFIVTLLFTLVELRVANLESVEIKLGTRNVILPLDGPVHVKRLKLAELAKLKLSIPQLVNLVEKVRGYPPPRRPVPPDRDIPPDPIMPTLAEDTESSETTPNSYEDIIDSNSTFTLNINSATSPPVLTFKQNRTTSQPKSSWNVDEINSKPTLTFNEDTEPPCPSTLLYDDAETLQSKESTETSHSITSKVDEVLSEDSNDRDLIISVPALPSHKQETVVKDFDIHNDIHVKAPIPNIVTTSPLEQYSTENAEEIFDHIMPVDVLGIDTYGKDLITSKITTSLPESDTSENVKEIYVHLVTDDTSMESHEKDPITDIPITSLLISNPTDITSVSFLPDYADNQEIFMKMKSRESDLTINIPDTSLEHDITTNFYHVSTNTPPPFTITDDYDRDSMLDSPLTLPSRYDVTANSQAKHIESYDTDSVSREITSELATSDIPTLFSFEKGRTKNNFLESYSHRRTGTLVSVTQNDSHLRVTSTVSAPVFTPVSETETNSQEIQTPTLNAAELHTRDLTEDFSTKASSESDNVTMDTLGINTAMKANFEAAESRVEVPARAPNTFAPDRQTESSPQARGRCTTADTSVLSPSPQTCTNKTESVATRKKIRRPCKHTRRGVRGRRRRRKRKPGAPGQARGRRRRRRRRRRRTTRAPGATPPRLESTTVSLTCGTEHCAHTNSTV